MMYGLIKRRDAMNDFLRKSIAIRNGLWTGST